MYFRDLMPVARVKAQRLAPPRRCAIVCFSDFLRMRNGTDVYQAL